MAKRLRWAALSIALLLTSCSSPTDVATEAEWGGIVALVNASSGDDLFLGQFCGGIAMSPTTIITAHHCVVDREPATVHVVAGVDDLCDPQEVGRQRSAVSSVMGIPKTDGLLSELRLAEPLEAVPPPPLPDAEMTAFGWGRSDIGGTPRCELRGVSLKSVDREACEPLRGHLAHDLVACSEPIESENSCDGDSGGPVYVRDPERSDGAPFTLAVTVSGLGCGPNSPGLNVIVDHPLQLTSNRDQP